MTLPEVPYDEKGEIEGIQPYALSGVLVGVIKEQQKMIESLKQELAEVKKQNRSM